MTEALWIVEVHDDRDVRLSGGRGSVSYASPPQPVAQALALVTVLLGGPEVAPQLRDAPWRVAIAGGRRDIRVHRASRDGQMTLG